MSSQDPLQCQIPKWVSHKSSTHTAAGWGWHQGLRGCVSYRTQFPGNASTKWVSTELVMQPKFPRQVLPRNWRVKQKCLCTWPHPLNPLIILATASLLMCALHFANLGLFPEAKGAQWTCSQLPRSAESNRPQGPSSIIWGEGCASILWEKLQSWGEFSDFLRGLQRARAPVGHSSMIYPITVVLSTISHFPVPRSLLSESLPVK